MTSRTLLLLSFTASVFLTVVYGESHPSAVAQVQPKGVAANMENQEIPPMPGQRAVAGRNRTSPPVKEIETLVPFLLKGAFDDYPAIPAAEVRIFEGENAFRKFLDDGSLTAWPIGEFKSVALPKDEAGFRQVMRNNAGDLGADYVVIYTDPVEIKRVFQWRLQEQFYCAQIFKRVKARLGIQRDEVATKENVTKVSGFLQGSRAEAGGLHRGDIIKTVDGVVPGGDDLYWSKALRWNVGDKVKVEVERDGKTVELEVELVAG